MSEERPTATDGLDCGSLAELAGTGARVWDSPALGDHAPPGEPERRAGTFAVPDAARTLVPRELFFV